MVVNLHFNNIKEVFLKILGCVTVVTFNNNKEAIVK